MDWKSWLYVLLVLVLVSEVVAAPTANLTTWYNPYTGRLDYIINAATIGNITGSVDGTGGWTNTSTTTSTGLDVNITSRATTTVPLTVHGVASQTANLQEWQNGSGYANTWINPSGVLTLETSAGTESGIFWQGGSKLLEQSTRMLYMPNSDSFEVLNEAGSSFTFSVHGSGAPSFASRVQSYVPVVIDGTGKAGTANLQVSHGTNADGLLAIAGNSAGQAVIAKGKAGQTANIFEVQDNNSVVLMSVEDDGWTNIQSIDLYTSGGYDNIIGSSTSGMILTSPGAFVQKGSSIQYNYNNGATGSWLWYGGTTSERFSVTNGGVVVAAGTINESTGRVCTFENGLCLVTTYFYATNASLVAGTGAGLLNDTWVYDGVSYNITEEAGSPGLDARFNFTNVTTFNQMLFRYKNTAGENHELLLQLWDYEDGDWETYGVESAVSDWAIFTFPVLDPSEHINNSIVQMRIYQSANGNIGHVHYFDYVEISNGPATASSMETDPYWIVASANVSRTGNCPAGEYVVNTTITGVECAAAAGAGTVTSVDTDGVYLYGGEITASGTISFNETKLNVTIDARDSDTTYIAGTGLYLSTLEFLFNSTWGDARYVNEGDDVDTWNTSAQMIAAINNTVGMNISFVQANITELIIGGVCQYYNGSHLVVTAASNC